MKSDFKYALRSLGRAPGFSLIAVVTLALGIGSSTAIFSVLDAVLLRPLPYPDQEQLVELTERSATAHDMPFSEANFNDLAARSHSFAALASYTNGPEAIAGGSEAVRVDAAGVSPDFFRALGVRPALGRLISSGSAADGNQVAVVSYGFWKSMLGGRSDLAGMTLRFENRAFSVIGVLPPGTEYPAGTEVWFPWTAIYPHYESRTAHNFRVIARLRPGVSFSQAQKEAASIGRAMKIENGTQTDATTFGLLSFRERFVRDLRGVLFVLGGAVGLLLAIACSNVANLLLVRANSRRKEVALRAALGASRAQLARQFLLEALLLALAGGTIGALLAGWSVPLMLNLYHRTLPLAGPVGLNLRVLFFTFAISLGVAFVLGLVPLFHVSRQQLQNDLRDASHGSSGAQTRARNALIVAQVALTLVLLVAAGLLARSFQRLLAVDPGFQGENAIAMTVSLPQPQEPAAARALAQFYRELMQRIGTLPGVTRVGGISALPMSGAGADGTFIEERGGKAATTMAELIKQLDALPPNERGRDADYRAASADYFAAMGIPLIRGRLFSDRDGPDAPHVALISQSLARRFWPNEDPIGKQIQFGNMDGDLHLLTTIGIVGDVRDDGLDREARPTVYTNYRQRPGAASEFSIVVRARGDIGSLTNAMRREVRALNPEAPVKFQTIEQIVSASFDNRRFSMVVLGVFAGAALLLAMVGLYGVMAFITQQRTREIGIRMALGAQRGDMLALILRQSLLLVAGGVLLGIAGSLGGMRLLASLLYGVSANDTVIYGGVVLLLGAAALLASYIPARRAMEVNPMVALHHE